MLVGGAFQSPECVRGSRGELPAEDSLDELPTPAWREGELSIERDAMRVSVNSGDLDVFVVRHAEGQCDIEHELRRRLQIDNFQRNAKHVRSKDEPIASADSACGTLDQLGPSPLRQFAWISEQGPNALGWSKNNVGRTNIHTSATVACTTSSASQWSHFRRMLLVLLRTRQDDVIRLC